MNRVSRLRSCGLASAIVLASLVALAPPAQAAASVKTELTQQDWSVDIAWQASTTPTAVYLDVFDSLTCAGGSSSADLPAVKSGSTTVAAGTVIEGVGDPVPLQPGTYGFQIQIYVGRATSSACMVGTVGWPPASDRPPSWFQSYGRASEDTACDQGWHASWAYWPHAGRGGFVCDRELYYDASRGQWAYR